MYCKKIKLHAQSVLTNLNITMSIIGGTNMTNY